jgi:hypothetical protein
LLQSLASIFYALLIILVIALTVKNNLFTLVKDKDIVLYGYILMGMVVFQVRGK